jgi:hypothetical protein
MYRSFGSVYPPNYYHYPYRQIFPYFLYSPMYREQYFTPSFGVMNPLYFEQLTMPYRRPPYVYPSYSYTYPNPQQYPGLYPNQENTKSPIGLNAGGNFHLGGHIKDHTIGIHTGGKLNNLGVEAHLGGNINDHNVGFHTGGKIENYGIGVQTGGNLDDKNLGVHIGGGVENHGVGVHAGGKLNDHNIGVHAGGKLSSQDVGIHAGGNIDDHTIGVHLGGNFDENGVGVQIGGGFNDHVGQLGIHIGGPK